MKLFGKRKKRLEDDLEDEDEFDEEEDSRKRKPVRKTSERKKKDLPRPWGKMERIWILVVIIITAGSSGILALKSRSWKLPGLPRFTVPKLPEISLLSDERIVIEGNKDNLQKSERIIEGFKSLTKNLSGVYGLYVVHLDDGYTFGVNEAEIFEPASLNKLAVIMTAYREGEKGNLDFDSKYSLRNADKVQGSGSLSSMPEGTTVTYRDLLNMMGKESDNTASGIMRKTLGPSLIAETTTAIGMSGTSITDNRTTPKDIGTFFLRLYRGGLVNVDSRDEILKSLTDTIYESWIPNGIPDGVRIAHKFGREVHVVNDAGIVFTNNPFVLVVMSKGIIEKEADEIIPEISKMVYDVETN